MRSILFCLFILLASDPGCVSAADVRPQAGDGLGSPGPAGGWSVRLIARSGRGVDEDNILGQLPGAVDGLDRFDRAGRPPPTREYVSVRFTNHRLPRTDWGYTRDLRASTIKPTGEWPFTVRASADVKYVTLSWKGKPQVLASAWLIDLKSGAFIRPSPGGRYSFPVEGQRDFVFAIYQR